MIKCNIAKKSKCMLSSMFGNLFSFGAAVVRVQNANKAQKIIQELYNCERSF